MCFAHAMVARRQGVVVATVQESFVCGKKNLGGGGHNNTGCIPHWEIFTNPKG